MFGFIMVSLMFGECELDGDVRRFRILRIYRTAFWVDRIINIA